MIRKGQVRWLVQGDIVGQITFIEGLFGLPDLSEWRTTALTISRLQQFRLLGV